MTDYNKKTYRVDDISWESSPESTFRMKDEDITYLDYYYKVFFELLWVQTYFILTSDLTQ
jgi:hypothetical protein